MKQVEDNKLEVNSFYFIIPVSCPDIDNDWMQEKQPARYHGDGRFNLMGSEDPWPAKWVGRKIEI